MHLSDYKKLIFLLQILNDDLEQKSDLTTALLSSKFHDKNVSISHTSYCVAQIPLRDSLPREYTRYSRRIQKIWRDYFVDIME